MTIYTTQQPYPYVYRIDHPTGEFYIGYRKANIVPANDDFGHLYKTSASVLSHPFEEYTHTILAEFFTGDGAYDFEQQTIFENWNDPLIANKSCRHGGLRFVNAGHSEETRAKLSEARKGKKMSEKNRLALYNANKGKKRSKETREKISKANKGQGAGRVLSEETRQKISKANKGKGRPKNNS